MEKHILQTILEDADLNVRSYSGRGMYGRKCLGVSCDSESYKDMMEAILDGVAQAASQDNWSVVDDVKEAMRNLQQDNLGMGTIVYWPRVEYAEGEDDEEEEETED